MKKDEFLAILRSAIEGKVSAMVVTNQLEFYDEYISEHAVNGKTEDEVIEEIGEPSLIAKSIIASEHAGAQGGYDYYQQDNVSQDEYEEESNRQYSHVGGWARTIGCLGILIVVIFILSFVLRFALYFSFPLIIVALVIGLYYSIFRKS